MVHVPDLWLPILVASALVFVMSSIIWMVLPWHKKDVLGTPDETSLVDALRRNKLTPGQYIVPFCADPAQRNSEEFKKKMADGPVAMITVQRPRPMEMGPMLTKWFIFLLILNAAIAYVCGLGLAPGADYMKVFRFAGTAAFLAYGGAHAVYGIFWGRPWRIVWLDIMDAFIYACIVAGAFGWRWPR